MANVIQQQMENKVEIPKYKKELKIEYMREVVSE